MQDGGAVFAKGGRNIHGGNLQVQAKGYKPIGPARTASSRISVQSTCRSLSRELLVFDALRHHRILAEAALLVFLVILEIAFEPFDMAVALEGEHVGGEAVEEHAVMADDDGTAGEILERLFKCRQRFG